MFSFSDFSKAITPIIIAVFLFQSERISAQTTQTIAEKAKEKFVSLAYTAPDSARYYLHYLIRYDSNQPDSVVAKHYNNLGLLHAMNSSRDSARFYYKKSIVLATGANKLGTMINLGVLYKKEREYNSAIDILNSAVEGYKKLDNEKGLGTTYGELASVYSMKEDRVTAIGYLKRGIALAKKHKMTRSLAIQQQNLATIYYKTRNYAFAKELYEECLPQLKLSNDKMNYAIALANYGSTLSALGKSKKSAVVLNAAALLVEPIDNDQIKAVVHGGIAAIALKNGNNKLAESEYEKSYQYILSSKSPESLSVVSGYLAMLNAQGKHTKALQIVNTIERTIDFRKTNEKEKLDFYNEASQTLLNTKQDARAVKALKDVIALKDSVSEIENDQQVKEVEAKYQADSQMQKAVHLQTVNKKLASSAEQLRSKYRYAAIGVFILAILLIWVGISMRNRNRKAAAELTQLEHQRLQNDKELHNERNKAKETEQLMQLQQQELLTESLRKVNFAEQLQAVVDEFKQRNDFNSAEKIENLSDQTHWKMFIEKFNVVNPHFIQKLSAAFPQLNQGELQFCALIKVNLSYKEIANILQITHQSVFTKKYRVKKKMAVDADTDFLNMIRSF